MAKRGRKRIEIDWAAFEGLCAIQATLREMAVFFGCSKDTIERAVKRHYKLNFAVVFAQKRLKGFISLRRTMWQSALSGDKTLLIFLAKQYLGMADQVVVNNPGMTRPSPEAGDLSRLTDEELEQLERLVNTAHGEPRPAAKERSEERPAGSSAVQPALDTDREAPPSTPPVNPTDKT